MIFLRKSQKRSSLRSQTWDFLGNFQALCMCAKLEKMLRSGVQKSEAAAELLFILAGNRDVILAAAAPTP